MTEIIKHECGIAMVRLLKPLSYYQKKYGSYLYGLNKLYLLMEKQHNRGQEGAGLACVKLHARPAEEFIYRERAIGTSAIQEIFANIKDQIKNTIRQMPTGQPYIYRLPVRFIWGTYVIVRQDVQAYLTYTLF